MHRLVLGAGLLAITSSACTSFEQVAIDLDELNLGPELRALIVGVDGPAQTSVAAIDLDGGRSDGIDALPTFRNYEGETITIGVRAYPQTLTALGVSSPGRIDASEKGGEIPEGAQTFVRISSGESDGQWVPENDLPDFMAGFRSLALPSVCANWEVKTYELEDSEPVSAAVGLGDGSAIFATRREANSFAPGVPPSRLYRVDFDSIEDASALLGAYSSTVGAHRFNVLYRAPDDRIWIASTVAQAQRTLKYVWSFALDGDVTPPRLLDDGSWVLRSLATSADGETLLGMSDCGRLHRLDVSDLISGEPFERFDELPAVEAGWCNQPAGSAANVAKQSWCGHIDTDGDAIFASSTNGGRQYRITEEIDGTLDVTLLERPGSVGFRGYTRTRDGIVAAIATQFSTQLYRLSEDPESTWTWVEHGDVLKVQFVYALARFRDGLILSGDRGFLLEVNPAVEGGACALIPFLANGIRVTELTDLGNETYLLTGVSEHPNHRVTLIRPTR